MSAEPTPDPEEDLCTVDELAAAAGLTVRTTRYYAGLGLLPPPIRRGRMAYYAREHRSRLELIRALQDHGFTLAAIDKFLRRIPDDASPEDLVLQRTMLTTWSSGPTETVTRRELERRMGRKVADDEVDLLVRLQAVREVDGKFELRPGFELMGELAALDIPPDSAVEAVELITRHMQSLADELTEILRKQVLVPFREKPHTDAEIAEFEQTIGRLRQLTLEAIVAGFKGAANQVINRSLTRDLS